MQKKGKEIYFIYVVFAVAWAAYLAPMVFYNFFDRARVACPYCLYDKAVYSLAVFGYGAVGCVIAGATIAARHNDASSFSPAFWIGMLINLLLTYAAFFGFDGWLEERVLRGYGL